MFFVDFILFLFSDHTWEIVNILVYSTKYSEIKPWTILFTQPLRSGRIWHKVNFFKRSLAGLNSEFSFS